MNLFAAAIWIFTAFISAVDKKWNDAAVFAVFAAFNIQLHSVERRLAR